jgi:NitT/TauT family transport system permease protein
VWSLGTFIFGDRLVPSLFTTFSQLVTLALTPDFWVEIAITLFRGITALFFTILLALSTGIAAGRRERMMMMISPLVAMLQATPPILWITLLMVWAGSGSAVPIVVVIASLFPPLFANVAYSTAALDRRLFGMARLYHVGRYRILKDLIWPGIFPFFLSGLSFALGTCWKVAAVAEFLGSSRGIGSRIYWSYRMLDMPVLFSWAVVLIGLGVSVEWGLIRPLRAVVEKGKGGYA